MEQNLEQHSMKPTGHPYRVPDGYFSELRDTLRSRIVEEGVPDTHPVSTWTKLKSLVGFVGAFGCLALLATVGFYFTGYKAQQQEQNTAWNAFNDQMLGYHLYAEDMTAMVVEEENSDGVWFAQAVEEYCEVSGYEGTEIENLLAETSEE